MWPVPFWNRHHGIVAPGGGGVANPCGTPGSDYEKLEGAFTAGADGHSVTVNGNEIVVLGAGVTYWPSSSVSFLTIIAARITIVLGGEFTVTGDFGDTGTGQVTMAWDGGNFTVDWTDETLRDLLGFDADLSGAATYTSAGACTHVWLVDRQRWFPPAPDGHDGKIVVNTKITASPSGTTKALNFGGRHNVNMLLWRFCRASKVWRTMETTANESFESFFDAVIGLGIPVRYHHDRSDNATYNQWRLGTVWMVEPITESLVGRGCDGADLYWSVGPIPARTHRSS
jgi:hypothetical protein